MTSFVFVISVLVGSNLTPAQLTLEAVSDQCRVEQIQLAALNKSNAGAGIDTRYFGECRVAR